MEKACVICKKLFKLDDEVEVLIRGKYVPMKSKVAWALQPETIDSVAGTAVHAECADDENFHDDSGPSLGPIGFNN